MREESFWQWLKKGVVNIPDSLKERTIRKIIQCFAEFLIGCVSLGILPLVLAIIHWALIPIGIIIGLMILLHAFYLFTHLSDFDC